ncbi:MAG: trypsin-like serine protease [Myxococcales bacterium]|nr:trypsin-like serine protease [Myxococcales bacterium]
MDQEPQKIGSTSQAIIGGESASVGDFPTTVAISNGGLCTGTLIAQDLVLTAAHCVLPSLLGVGTQDQVTGQTQVIFDTDDLYSSGGRAIQAAETIPHPDFSINGLGDNDIALIRLQTPVTDRTPTPINRSREDAKAGLLVTQVGYGATQVGGSQAGRLFAIDAKRSTSCSNFGSSDDKLLCFSQMTARASAKATVAVLHLQPSTASSESWVSRPSATRTVHNLAPILGSMRSWTSYTPMHHNFSARQTAPAMLPAVRATCPSTMTAVSAQKTRSVKMRRFAQLTVVACRPHSHRAGMAPSAAAMASVHRAFVPRTIQAAPAPAFAPPTIRAAMASNV